MAREPSSVPLGTAEQDCPTAKAVLLPLDLNLPYSYIPLLFHPFNKHLLNTYYMPGTMLNTGELSHCVVVKGKCIDIKELFKL